MRYGRASAPGAFAHAVDQSLAGMEPCFDLAFAIDAGAAGDVHGPTGGGGLRASAPATAQQPAA